MIEKLSEDMKEISDEREKLFSEAARLGKLLDRKTSFFKFLYDKKQEQLKYPELDFKYPSQAQLKKMNELINDYADETPRIYMSSEVVFVVYSFITLGIEADGYCHS